MLTCINKFSLEVKQQILTVPVEAGVKRLLICFYSGKAVSVGAH